MWRSVVSEHANRGASQTVQARKAADFAEGCESALWLPCYAPAAAERDAGQLYET